MVKWTIPPVLLLIASLSNTAGMQEPPTPWRDDPAFQRLAKALDGVLAIDTHTHLLRTGKFNPAIAERTPLLNRSTHPWYPAIVKARFGLDVDRRDWAKGDAAIDAARSEMIKRLGDHGYWMDHLDYTRTEIALVNENSRTADVPQAQAADLYAKGVKAPLARDEYLALQDFLWRHILDRRDARDRHGARRAARKRPTPLRLEVGLRLPSICY